VLLVHGLYHNASAWLPMRQRLRRRGFDRVYAYSYNSLRHDFDSLMRLLHDRATELRRRFPGEKIVLVGHSLGGLQVRAYASRPEAADELAAVVTLGAPHQGSKLAALGIGRLARQLIYRSALPEYLATRRKPETLPGLSLFTRADEYVLPRRGLRLPPSAAQGWTEEETACVSHVSMLYSKTISRRVIDFLERLPIPQRRP